MEPKSELMETRRPQVDALHSAGLYRSLKIGINGNDTGHVILSFLLRGFFTDRSKSELMETISLIFALNFKFALPIALNRN